MISQVSRRACEKRGSGVPVGNPIRVARRGESAACQGCMAALKAERYLAARAETRAAAE